MSNPALLDAFSREFVTALRLAPNPNVRRHAQSSSRPFSVIIPSQDTTNQTRVSAYLYNRWRARYAKDFQYAAVSQ